MCDISTNDNGFCPTTFVLYGPINRLNNLTVFMYVAKNILFYSFNNNKMGYKQYNKNNKVVSSVEQIN